MTTTATATFQEQRRRLMGVSYRILGSIADAEDVVQDAWLRWSATDVATVNNPEAYLTTVVTRLSLDRLRTLKARREVYSGPWLPEPVTAETDPQAAAELADSLSLALLVVLETLSPLERAAFVLREVFAEPYAEVAETLGRDEAAVRQLVSRARKHVDAGGARYRADRYTHNEVVERFLSACQNADLDALLAVLAPDVVLVSDGGGVAKAPVRPISGEDKVGRFMIGATTKGVADATVQLEVFNGQLGLVARVDGRAVVALAFRIADGQVQMLHLVANPGKLAALDAPIPLD
ncbi:MAG TPA: RNA polymerase sigma-70 factor [Propionibacteriaceae bacterium]|jgi:RNA polymerase sigma-70 factor (ECF subfamily)|nr:RNA polymerase sigma-70 factor [Propionibacteriaceae bacterium]